MRKKIHINLSYNSIIIKYVCMLGSFLINHMNGVWLFYVYLQSIRFDLNLCNATINFIVRKRLHVDVSWELIWKKKFMNVGNWILAKFMNFDLTHLISHIYFNWKKILAVTIWCKFPSVNSVRIHACLNTFGNSWICAWKNSKICHIILFMSSLYN